MRAAGTRGVRRHARGGSMTAMDDVSLIITTHNRAALLRDTLASVARLDFRGRWETVVVDNNSSDTTAQVVADARRSFTVPLRYLFEPHPGKYAAFNTGIRQSRGAIVANTDDDVELPRDWLTRATDGFGRYRCDFVGGPVHPIWETAPPAWIDVHDPICGKVLAQQDHGPEPREYGRDGISWPLGVNIVYRRDAFARAGLFDARLGRAAGTLRNQSQREWHLRARAAGLRGMYLPGMVVRHFVPADRLTRRYFYRWFYWHGISRAIMYASSGTHLLEPESDSSHAGERHLLGVPASIWRGSMRGAFSAAARWAARRPDEALQYELQVVFLAGAVRQRLTDRKLPAQRRGCVTELAS